MRNNKIRIILPLEFCISLMFIVLSIFVYLKAPQDMMRIATTILFLVGGLAMALVSIGRTDAN